MKNKTRFNFLACILAAFFLGQGKSFADTPSALVAANQTAVTSSLVEKLTELAELDTAEEKLGEYAKNTEALTKALIEYAKLNPEAIRSVAQQAVEAACRKKAGDDKKIIEKTLLEKGNIQSKLSKLDKLPLATMEGKREKEDMESQGMNMLSTQLTKEMAKEKSASNS